MFFIDNLLVRIHHIIVMMMWTGLAPWEFEFPFPGSRASTFLVDSARAYTSEIAKNARAVRAVVHGAEGAAEIQDGLQTCQTEG